MNKIFIDSSAWIEYFSGSEKGNRVREYVLKPDATILTTGLVATEVCAKFLKDSQPAETAAQMLQSLTVLFPYGYQLGLATAKIYVKERKDRPKFSLADAHVLAAARMAKTRLITCDNDFSGMSDALVIR